MESCMLMYGMTVILNGVIVILAIKVICDSAVRKSEERAKKWTEDNYIKTKIEE